MKDNQSGMTLVELLAVLVLVSLVTGIIWTTMSISIKHNAVETTKLQLQQEANAVITKIQQIHRREACYTLSIQENEVSVVTCDKTPVIKEVLGNSYEYAEIVKGDQLHTDTTHELKDKSTYDLNLYVQDPDNEKLFIDVRTKISRYKSEQGEG